MDRKPLIYVPAVMIFLISCGFLYKNSKKISLISRFCLASIFKKKICNYKIPDTNIMRVPIGDDFLSIPFDQTKEFDMCFITVHGIDNAGKNHDLTHLAGVPYAFSAEDLGLERILVTNAATLEHKEFTGDDVIGYAEGL